MMFETIMTIEEFYEKIKDKQHLISGKDSLDETIKDFDNLTIQRLVIYISPKDLAISFRGLSERGIKQFVENISRRSARMIMDDCLFLKNITENDIIEAQQKILNKINELKESKEI